MNQHEVNLTLALYYEHKGRTGHDCTNRSGVNRTKLINCDACLFLDKLMQAAEAAQSPPEPESAPVENDIDDAIEAGGADQYF